MLFLFDLEHIFFFQIVVCLGISTIFERRSPIVNSTFVYTAFKNQNYVIEYIVFVGVIVQQDQLLTHSYSGITFYLNPVLKIFPKLLNLFIFV